MTDTPTSISDLTPTSAGDSTTALQDAGRDTLAALEAQRVNKQDDSGNSDQNANDASSKVTSGKILVDYGGTSREMDVADLVSAAQKSEKIEEMERVAQEQLAKATQATGFINKIESLDPSVQQKIAALIQGQAAPDETDDFDPHDFDTEPSPNRQSNPLEGEVQQLRTMVKQLAKLHQADHQEKQEASLMETVDELVNGFPVFKESPEASEFAMDAIKSDIAAARANGEISRKDAEKIVAHRAAGLHKVLQSQIPSAPGEVERVPLSLQSPDKPPTADDLMSGGVRRMIARHVTPRNGH